MREGEKDFMMSNEPDIDELFTEWEDRINFLTDHISELESQILYYQNLVAEKDVIINQLRAENTTLKGGIQTHSVQQPTRNLIPPNNLVPPPKVLHPPPNLNSYPDVTIQAEKPIEIPRAVRRAPLISSDNLSDDVSLKMRQCPHCGAFGFAIKEMDDKTQVLCYKPIKIYAKKRVCTKCRHEF
jgi:hypothetical protein